MLQAKPPTPRMKPQTRTIVDRILRGGHIPEIAREFGISRQRVHEIKNKYTEEIDNESDDEPGEPETPEGDHLLRSHG